MNELLAVLGDRTMLSVAVLFFGLCVGSFLNVVIYRLPIMLNRQWHAQALEVLAEQAGGTATAPHVDAGNANELMPFNLVTPRSTCPCCQTPIKPWHNIPVLGFLFLRGRCATCKARISWRYPLVEALTATLFVFAGWLLGADFLLIGALLFTALLIAMSGIDFDTKLLPDQLTYLLLWSGLLFSLIGGFTSLTDAVIGAMAGYLTLWSVYWGFKLTTGKEGMGYGDFKLLAALGAWLGWQQLPLIIILSALSGLLIGGGAMLFAKDKSPQIPFGPHLAIAGWVAMFFGPGIIDGYLRAVGL